MRVIHFRPYAEPSPEVLELYAAYRPTLEDLFEVAEYFAEAWEIRNGARHSIAFDSVTVNERIELADTHRRAA